MLRGVRCAVILASEGDDGGGGDDGDFLSDEAPTLCCVRTGGTGFIDVLWSDWWFWVGRHLLGNEENCGGESDTTG